MFFQTFTQAFNKLISLDHVIALVKKSKRIIAHIILKSQVLSYAHVTYNGANMEPSVNEPIAATQEPSRVKKLFATVLDSVRVLLLTLAVVVPIRLFIVSPFVVSGGSMEPTFETGHYLIVDELSYYFREPARGEVIVFHYPKDTTKFFIKRVIGLPGETVTVNHGSVMVTKADGTTETLSEPYVAFPRDDSESRTLAADEYFVMGDNRAGSSDSRFWGPVKKSLITGRAAIRLYPVPLFDFLPGLATYK